MWNLTTKSAVTVILEIDSGNPAKSIYNLRKGPNYFRLGEIQDRPVKGLVIIKNNEDSFECLFSKKALNVSESSGSTDFYTAVELGHLAGDPELAGYFSDLENSEKPASFGPLSERQAVSLITSVMLINYETEFRADAVRRMRGIAARAPGFSPG